MWTWGTPGPSLWKVLRGVPIPAAGGAGQQGGLWDPPERAGFRERHRWALDSYCCPSTFRMPPLDLAHVGRKAAGAGNLGGSPAVP